MSTTLKYWDETAAEWKPFRNDATASSSIKVKEVPIGLVNGSNANFTTSQAYIGGTLQVYVNGLAQSGLITETDSGAGTFSLDTAPETGDTLAVYYHIAGTPLGNTDSWNNYSMTGFLEALYPVGAIYTSGSSTMPAIIDGIGTWVRIEGRFVVGASDSDPDFDYGDTGGAKDVTLTTAQLARHKHLVRGLTSGDSVGFRYSSNGRGATNMAQQVSNVNADTYTGTLYGYYEGNDQPHENLPPYKAIYMWERSA